MSATPITEILEPATVVAVLTIERAEDAVPVAQALAKGGIKVVEVTLRTDAALEALKLISQNVPDVAAGLGTVLKPGDIDKAVEAGARFTVSPGATPALLRAGKESPIPLLPGTATSSEIMTALDHGYDVVKFFPVASLGGAGALKTLGGPFPTVRFCPTGGITPESAVALLRLPNVLCIGSSWLASKELIANADWARITELSRNAMSLRAA